MKPIRLLCGIALVLAAIAPGASAQSLHPLPRRPNIILIVANGLSAGDLSCYGQTFFQTPNLDKLAASGVRFTHYTAGAPAGSPARAALMTGRDISIAADDVTLTPDEITIAQVLKNSGYFTSLIGEWDLGGEGSSGAPWLKGFDEFAGYFDARAAADAYAQYMWRYECDPVHNDIQTYNGTEPIYGNWPNGQKVEYTADFLTTLAMTFTKENQPDTFNHYRPFFLVLTCPIPGNGNREVPTDAPFSEESWPQAEKNRAAMIARLDNNIGQLVGQLDKVGQTTNTVIFFTSDTVPKKAGGTDPKFFHENTSSNLLVPMIVSWPDKIPGGQVSDLDCSAHDILPTIAGLGLVTPPGKIDGTSFLPALFGKARK